MMRTSETIDALAAALAKAQGELEGAKKDSTNPHYRSKYADLASVVDALKACFPKHGLSYVQTVVTQEAGVGVETRLMHASGQWIEGDAFALPVNKADAQGFGSCLTYARRYSLAAIAGVAPEDDDGNAAAAAAPKTAADGVIDRIKGANVTARDSMGEVYRAYPEEERMEIDRIADEATALIKGGDVAGAAAMLHEFCGTDNESRLAVSYRLAEAGVLNKLKAHKQKSELASQA